MEKPSGEDSRHVHKNEAKLIIDFRNVSTSAGRAAPPFMEELAAQRGFRFVQGDRAD
jgi:hypothetical protein